MIFYNITIYDMEGNISFIKKLILIHRPLSVFNNKSRRLRSLRLSVSRNDVGAIFLQYLEFLVVPSGRDRRL